MRRKQVAPNKRMAHGPDVKRGRRGAGGPPERVERAESLIPVGAPRVPHCKMTVANTEGRTGTQDFMLSEQ